MDELIDAVLAQIAVDVELGDVTAIEDLLRHCSEEQLKAYLPEDFFEISG
jgi:hypothetical protein